MPSHCPDCLHPIERDSQTHALPMACPHCGNPLVDAETDDSDAVPSDIAALLHNTVPTSGRDPASTTPTAPTDTPPAPEDASPAEPLPAPAPIRSSAWQWLLAAALLLALTLQALVADRVRLAADPRWRPVLTKLCGALRCSLPAWREPSAFSMLERDVAPLADHAGVLHVHATFRNDAQWPQPWPALQLSLADGDGRTVASRTLLPQEYLGRQPDQELAAGQSARISFFVREPETGAVSFTFAFH